MGKVEKTLLKTAGFMAAATFLAKLLGLVRDSLIAAFFGTGIQAEAYLTATRLPTTVFDLVIGGVISATFIPVFNTALKKEGRENAMLFANRFVGMILIICLAISAIGMVFSGPLVSFLAPDFDAERHELASQLTRIMFPMIIFTGLAFSFVGILQSFGEFNIPALMSLVSNVAVIIYFIIFGKKFGVYGLAVTMCIAWGLQVLIQIPSLKKFDYRFRPSINFRDPNIKRALSLALPMLVSTWVQPLYTVVNTRLASGIDKGVSSLDYANRLYIVITGVFSFVITNLIFPKMSRANAGGDDKEAKQILKSSSMVIVLIVLPLTALFIILAEPIISVIYERGNFSHDDVVRCCTALSCYSTGMIGLAMNEVLSKGFFSMQNSKTPMINALLSMAANVALAYTLVNPLGISGLALASAGGSIVNALLNYISIRRRFGRIFEKKDLFDILKAACATLLLGAIVYFLYGYLSGIIPKNILSQLLCACAAGGAGLIAYLAFCLLTKVGILSGLLGKKGKNQNEQ